MIVTIPLDQMTTTEKLLAMENIWDNLCQKTDEVPFPLWHKKILQQREEKVKKGIEKFSDWENAKKNKKVCFMQIKILKSVSQDLQV